MEFYTADGMTWIILSIIDMSLKMNYHYKGYSMKINENKTKKSVCSVYNR